jgi:hypothetical protein
MKFKVEMDVEVQDHDADIMSSFSEAVQQRFDGTAIRINHIRVVKVTERQRTVMDVDKYGQWPLLPTN